MIELVPLYKETEKNLFSALLGVTRRLSSTKQILNKPIHAGTLNFLTSQPPELWGSIFLFKPPVYDIFVIAI